MFIKLPYIQAKWRCLNRHNFTTVGNRFEDYLFPTNKVKVGRYTYGALRVFSYSSLDEGLIIGSFCSIAEDVTFMLGGGHNYNKALTYPFLSIFDHGDDALSKGAIRVGDDVWIGAKSTILSGVTLSQGTVVAAGSLVTKDTKPYSIVAGVPARIIKYRFDEDTITKLLSVDFDKIDFDFYAKNRNVINSSPQELLRAFKL